MKYRAMSWCVVLAFVVLQAFPAFACKLTGASATDNCTGYTLAVNLSDLGEYAQTLDYKITLTPTSGKPIVIKDSLTVGPETTTGTYSFTKSETWASYGVTLTSGYKVTGTIDIATLTPHQSRKIVFSNPTLSCGVSPLSLSCPSSTAELGIAYSSAFTASGGVPPYTFSITAGSLPPGLTINPSTGAVTGTPTTSGTDSFTGEVTDSTSATATASCSIAIAPPPGSCQPSSSLAVLVQGTNVTTYVPNGAWDTTSTGLSAVSTEGTGFSGAIATPNTVNSCAANPLTGEVVCTSNVADVYLVNGSTLTTTISSDESRYTSFSGGVCETCGVAMNATTNQAVLTIGDSSATSGSGLDFLNLSTNVTTAVPMYYEVSEDVLWDQGRNLVLSPNESGVYDLYNVATGVEYGQSIGGTLDSAAEECSTGIALATDEFTADLFIVDLTQATFTAGTPGSWTTTAEQFQNFPEFGNFAAGTSGIAIAQGSHLGITTGEFGGNWMGVIQLPSTSGSGTPAVLDWAAVALPATPDGATFEQGLDPHTVTAYVSPNSGDAIGLMANGYFVPPTWLAYIDLTKLLAAPRTSGTHYVDPSVNLETSGILTYVAVP